MRRRDLARRYGRNGSAVLELFDTVRALSAADLRRLGENRQPVLTLIRGAAATKPMTEAVRRRHAEVVAARAEAWRLAAAIDTDPDMLGARTCEEVAGALVVRDLLPPGHYDRISAAWDAALDPIVEHPALLEPRDERNAA